MNEEDFDLEAGILHHEEGVDLMPANIELSGVETSLIGIMSSETTLRDYIELMELIRENIDYDVLMSDPKWREREMYEELYQLICEVVCVPRKTIRIAGQEYPYNLVKSKFTCKTLT